jgi:hypothetical protein
MMHKAKVAVCSDIRTKHSTKSERHVEFFNVKTLWYVKKPLGVKKVNKTCSLQKHWRQLRDALNSTIKLEYIFDKITLITDYSLPYFVTPRQLASGRQGFGAIYCLNLQENTPWM